MTDSTLERLLASTARAVTYPPTPELRSRVLTRIAEAPPRHALGLKERVGVRGRLRPALGLVALAATLLLAVALAIGPSRDAIARFFGVEGSRIEVLPTPAPGVTATPFPTPAPLRNILVPVPLTELTRHLDFEPAIPETAEPLGQAYYVLYGDEPVAVLSYPSFDLWQTELNQHASFGKSVEADSIQLEVEVNGQPATWLSGSEHGVSYTDGYGNFIWGSTRTVTRSTLIWRTDRLFYRIETDLPLEEALRIAETLP